jgi:hypothetical protein
LGVNEAKTASSSLTLGRRWRRQGLGDSAKPEARSICLSIPLINTHEWLPIDARLFGLADLQILEYFAINNALVLTPGGTFRNSIAALMLPR